MTEEIKKDLAVEEAPAKKTRKAAPKAEGEKKTTAKKASTKKAKAEETAAPATLTIKLVKSLAGRIQNQKDCAAALGLKKVGDVTVQPDNTATKGKIVKISHLVEVTK